MERHPPQVRHTAHRSHLPGAAGLCRNDRALPRMGNASLKRLPQGFFIHFHGFPTQAGPWEFHGRSRAWSQHRGGRNFQGDGGLRRRALWAPHLDGRGRRRVASEVLVDGRAGVPDRRLRGSHGGDGSAALKAKAHSLGKSRVTLGTARHTSHFRAKFDLSSLRASYYSFRHFSSVVLRSWVSLAGWRRSSAARRFASRTMPAGLRKC